MMNEEESSSNPKKQNKKKNPLYIYTTLLNFLLKMQGVIMKCITAREIKRSEALPLVNGGKRLGGLYESYGSLEKKCA